MNINVQSCGESSGCEGIVGVVFVFMFILLSLWSTEGVFGISGKI